MKTSDKYVELIIPRLDADLEIINGQKTYNFKCPWCYHFFDGIDARERKCASLVPSQDRYEWKFICMRSRSQECRRIHGGRSLYNFLAMYDHDLFTQYQLELKQENQQ